MHAQEKRFQWPPQAPSIKGYQLAGATPGGIFLHGFRSHCDGEKSRALAQYAAARGRAWLRYNQRHCARGDDEFALFTISQAIKDAVALLDFLRRPSVLVGSSLGAVIALQAAQRRRRWTSGLLLLAPAVRFVERHFLSLPTGELRRWQEQGVKAFPDHYDGGSFALNYSFLQDAMHYRRLGPWKLDCPVTIIHGREDELLPVEDSVELAAIMQAPSIDLEVIALGDHRLNDAIPIMCQKLDTFWTVN